MSHPDRHAITRLTLTHFRNYAAFDLSCDAGPVVLTGPNGAGKTNILEAISLLTPGRGLRRARFAAMVRQAEGQAAPGWAAPGWVVSAAIEAGDEAHVLGTSFTLAEGQPDKRLTRCDGETLRTQAELSRHCAALWLTPQMETLFLEAKSERRKFLDRLVYSFDPAHAARVGAFEHHMRERNRLLYERRRDAAWLSVLETKIAEASTAIAASRVETVERLNAALREDALFARPLLEVTGDAEAWLIEGEGALVIEARLAERLETSRGADAAAGRMGAGAHRSGLLVWHEAHRREAEFCSTGEQKAMLLSILLAHAKARAEWCGSAPLLLLDEVVSHLDKTKRETLFEAILELKIQAWLTGTDAADFSGLTNHATMRQL